ncbi:MAG: hypothetical protein AAFU53_08270 [Cyanobacteria bacterium J06632_3]
MMHTIEFAHFYEGSTRGQWPTDRPWHVESSILSREALTVSRLHRPDIRLTVLRFRTITTCEKLATPD